MQMNHAPMSVLFINFSPRNVCSAVCSFRTRFQEQPPSQRRSCPCAGIISAQWRRVRGQKLISRRVLAGRENKENNRAHAAAAAAARERESECATHTQGGGVNDTGATHIHTRLVSFRVCIMTLIMVALSLTPSLTERAPPH
jgi:hypothetical protein